MTAQKLKSCPDCGHHVFAWKYESGWWRAECDRCMYIAEPATTEAQAARNHNNRALAIEDARANP